MSRKSLAEIFIAGDSRASSLPNLAEKLEELVKRCHHELPELAVSASRFVAYLAEKNSEDMPVDGWLDRVHAEDLYLAFACAGGVERAVDTFETRFGPDLDRTLRKVCGDSHLREDALQTLRERLFVPAEGRSAKISAYSGRGTLQAWLRITATRIVLELRKREAKEPAADEDEILGLPSPEDNPETAHLKRLYQAEFKVAFEASIAELPDRARTLLAQYHIDGLTIDQLGAQYNVHRMTAARWVAGARSDLLKATQRRLETQLVLSEQELDSVLQLIRSRLDVSISRVLSKKEPAS